LDRVEPCGGSGDLDQGKTARFRRGTLATGQARKRIRLCSVLSCEIVWTVAALSRLL
jgi:hypothetical protein